MAGALHLGTSGFAYDAWMNGVFYPKGIRLDGRLAYYASVFNAVEINYTFRRFPSDELFAGWREAAPEGFTFALKANQRITHTLRLKGAGEVAATFARRAALLDDHLGPILFQCPPTLEYDEPLICEFLDALPSGLRAAMEFRHSSWRAARDLLEARGVAWCVAETDEGDPAAADVSWRPFGYLRLRRARYSVGELRAWAERIGEALAAGSDVHCYFKHEDEAAGPRMAIRLRKMLDHS